jgi:hypothetical protein
MVATYKIIEDVPNFVLLLDFDKNIAADNKEEYDILIDVYKYYHKKDPINKNIQKLDNEKLVKYLILENHINQLKKMKDLIKKIYNIDD